MRTAWWWRRAGRIAWAALTVVVVETVVLGAAVLPAMAFVSWQGTWARPAWQRLALGALGVVPLYLLVALLLMICTAGATRLLGWRTADGLEEPLMDGSWAVLTWARYLVTIHVVRVFAGPAYRSTPAWSWYLRLNGAQLGHAVWVNSLALMDHNLLLRLRFRQTRRWVSGRRPQDRRRKTRSRTRKKNRCPGKNNGKPCLQGWPR